MRERSIVLLPRLQTILETLGENLKLARLRRKLTVIQVAERAGITRTTLWQIERGAAHVSMAAYAQVLLVLGLEKDLLKLAADDEMGKRILDSGLIVKQRGPKR